MSAIGLAPRRVAHGLIRLYQLTLSALIGRQCRYLPTCSHYADEAIARHGLWAGGWMGFARVCRCRPYGGSGYDPPPEQAPGGARWFAPWRYADWRGPAP
ncbi:MAG: membrane protein insertion efficiency factor YidD [Roseiarcus sp.]|jgi:uncharacterized protein